MKFLMFVFLLVGCPKKADDKPVSIMPIGVPLPLDEDAFEDLPEADDTSSDYYEDVTIDDEDITSEDE